MSENKDDRRVTRIFRKQQSELFEKSLEESIAQNPVECLGQVFESDAARRVHFLSLLEEKLKDPDFRNRPGFPKGTDEDILRLSDPPFYTACPNPFLRDYIQFFGRPYEPAEEYSCEPFAVDVSEGKTDQLYRAHSYHTKVPHLAIVPSILHYTKPGDIVLDGFCGSGMTGIAAQWCDIASLSYRREIEEKLLRSKGEKPIWGPRRVILGDLGPAATFIASNYNIPFDVGEFVRAAQQVLDEVEAELGWMYETNHPVSGQKCRINYTVWTDVFACPECSGEIDFISEALHSETKRVKAEFPCPHCGSSLKKKQLERLYQTIFDPYIRENIQTRKRNPAIINYSIGKDKYEKTPDEADVKIIERIAQLGVSQKVPCSKLPFMHMTHERARMDRSGITHVHHFFMDRPRHVLGAIEQRVASISDVRLRHALQFLFEQGVWSMSLMNKYEPIQFGRANIRSSQVGRFMKGVYYVSSMHPECSPWYVHANKLKRLGKAFSTFSAKSGTAIVSTGDCSRMDLPDNAVDYVFTDPPFGENIYYADLNFLVESWLGVMTDAEPEAIVDRAKKKSTVHYQALMRNCFEEYQRVLKPGRWMTVVFSNSKNHIWRAIQEAIGTAGFVVADVRTLDKKQGSYRQVTSSAVKQDLVISAYKPTEALSGKFKLGVAEADSVWSFVDEHLGNVPVFVGGAGEADIIAERTPQMLHDRMIAFFVQRRVAVPISGHEFFAGLDARYPKRDSMYFLQGQVSQYDKKRTTVSALRQLSLFVSDEASATQWVRQQLQVKPQTFQDLQPQFMQQLQSWAKHEVTIELKEILEFNFMCYESKGPVPAQIHSYLSTNFKDLRKLCKEDDNLKAKALDRWYVPDPSKEGDLERQRLRTLLKEFEEYRASSQRKIKQFRTEAVRAGFKHCYDEQDYQTIVDVAAKLPEQVIQEDEKLLMYYDVATMRIGD